MPAMAGWKIPLPTPAPEYVPPSGIPPLSLNGWAVVVVIESKQRVNVTTGDVATFIVMVLDVTGFPMGQAMDEVRMHTIWSPETGVYEHIEEFVPALTPLTFHW